MEKVRDYIQIVLEIIVMIGVMMYLLGNIKDYFAFQYEAPFPQSQAKPLHYTTTLNLTTPPSSFLWRLSIRNVLGHRHWRMRVTNARQGPPGQF